MAGESDQMQKCGFRGTPAPSFQEVMSTVHGSVMVHSSKDMNLSRVLKMVEFDSEASALYFLSASFNKKSL